LKALANGLAKTACRSIQTGKRASNERAGLFLNQAIVRSSLKPKMRKDFGIDVANGQSDHRAAFTSIA